MSVKPQHGLRVLTLLVMIALPLCAETDATLGHKTQPAAHEANHRLAVRAYENNVHKYAGNTNYLIRPGLVADQIKRRVEVMVERSSVGRNQPCEFLLIGESSDHAYEALLISFAKPSDVHGALQFIGAEPGEPFDPSALRFWAKGETFQLGIARTNEAPLPIEQMLLDRRTGNTIREEGFMFTGSRLFPVTDTPGRQFYAADEIQPKAVVSLFNSTWSVFEVPYEASKGEVYQNTSVNPEHPFPEGSILTLVIEPVNKDGTRRVKDLALHVGTIKPLTNNLDTEAERLSRLRLQLKDGVTALNKKTGLVAAVESLAVLDQKKHDYYLTVYFGENVELRQAQALSKILSTMDNEKGVRIEPPATGQLYYRSFAPDHDLLDRNARMFHPWELSLTEEDGQMSGKLLLVESVWRKDGGKPELAFTEFTVSSPQELRKALDTEAASTAKSEKRAKPAVIMVFASPRLQHGRLMTFLEPVLQTYKSIYVYMNDPMPPVPTKKQSP